MKVTDQLVEILKNFSTVNQGIKITQGNVLKTRNMAKSLVAYATVDQEFPQDFCIYDLGAFLSTLNLFEDPVLEFKDTHVVIKGETGKSRVRFMYAEEAVIATVDRDIKLPSPNIEFLLTKDNIKKLQKSSSILNAEDIRISGTPGKKIEVSATDQTNETKNEYTIELPEKADASFEIFVKAKYLSFIPDDYHVDIVAPKAARFRGETKNVEYIVSAEKSSKYEA